MKMFPIIKDVYYSNYVLCLDTETIWMIFLDSLSKHRNTEMYFLSTSGALKNLYHSLEHRRDNNAYYTFRI